MCFQGKLYELFGVDYMKIKLTWVTKELSQGQRESYVGKTKLLTWHIKETTPLMTH